MRALLASLVLLVAACPGGHGKSNDTPPPPLPDDKPPAAEPADAAPPAAQALTPEQAAKIDRLTELTLDLGAQIATAQRDCDKMAEITNAWVDTNAAEQNQLIADLADAPQQAASDRARANTQRYLADLKAMVDDVNACADHEGFKKAWQRIEGE